MAFEMPMEFQIGIRSDGVKGIAQAHDEDIKFESLEKIGSSFTVELPPDLSKLEMKIRLHRPIKPCQESVSGF
jgi:hypothetical protein